MSSDSELAKLALDRAFDDSTSHPGCLPVDGNAGIEACTIVQRNANAVSGTRAVANP